MMWIETESGNLINSDVVGEIAIVGPYEIDGCSSSCYDLYAFNVGDVEMSYGRSKPFRDAHRYLIQHSNYGDCEKVLERLKEGLRNGSRYFDTRATLDWIRSIEKHRVNHKLKEAS